MMIARCAVYVHRIYGCIQVFLGFRGEELIVDTVDRILHAAAFDEAGDTDLRGADDLDVDVRV